LDYEPNREALMWFVESIFPAFGKAYPDAKLTVVGRYPDSTVKKLCAGRRDIELHADVPDLKPFYARARAVVVPVLRGGGTRIKILEAALAERPILSTPFGASGLALTLDRDLLCFASAEDFLRQYARLSDRGSYTALTTNAKDLVTKEYSAAAFNAAMERVLEAVGPGTLDNARP
jgi:glycosyltransferase involved in cell wall biosynthesis